MPREKSNSEITLTYAEDIQWGKGLSSSQKSPDMIRKVNEEGIRKPGALKFIRVTLPYSLVLFFVEFYKKIRKRGMFNVWYGVGEDVSADPG